MGSLTKKNKTANTGLDKARQIPPPAPLITGPFELSINNSIIGPAYVGWTLSSCSLRITDQPQADRLVILKNSTSCIFFFGLLLKIAMLGYGGTALILSGSVLNSLDQYAFSSIRLRMTRLRAGLHFP
jgi:hypothetical protein